MSQFNEKQCVEGISDYLDNLFEKVPEDSMEVIAQCIICQTAAILGKSIYGAIGVLECSKDILKDTNMED